MSIIYDQIKEITVFLLENEAIDSDDLYLKMISGRDEKNKIDCFRFNKFDLENSIIYAEDISKSKFKRLVSFMDKIKIVESKLLKLIDHNKEIIDNFNIQNFNEMMTEIIREYFFRYKIAIREIKKEVIPKIEYPQLRNSSTIHSKVKEIINPEKMIGIQDFSKLMTLLSDIDFLERKSVTLYF